VRSTDTVARLGGDEFTVILSELRNAGDVVRTAQEILKKMSTPFQLGENVAHISSSIGITLYPEDGKDAETLIKNADQAMYAAKQQGRNRFNYFAPFMQEATRERMNLVNELREAVRAMSCASCTSRLSTWPAAPSSKRKRWCAGNIRPADC
jgi:predicted signal transduction protein with EAL and GGDEF domain